MKFYQKCNCFLPDFQQTLYIRHHVPLVITYIVKRKIKNNFNEMGVKSFLYVVVNPHYIHELTSFYACNFHCVVTNRSTLLHYEIAANEVAFWSRCYKFLKWICANSFNHMLNIQKLHQKRKLYVYSVIPYIFLISS